MRISRDTILSGAIAGVLVLAAGSILTSQRAPASLPAAPAAPPEARIATVDTLTILQSLWEQPELDSARRALAERLTGQLQAKQDEVNRSEQNLQTLAESSRTRWMALPEGDPGRAEIEAAFNTAQEFHNQIAQAFEQLRTDAQTQFDNQKGEQVRACFAKVKEAVAAVAGEGGYTYVLSHATNDDQLQKYNFDGVIQAVRDRPVLISPEGVDITDAVLTRLGVGRPTYGQGSQIAPGGAPDASPDGVPAQPILPPPGQ